MIVIVLALFVWPLASGFDDTLQWYQPSCYSTGEADYKVIPECEFLYTMIPGFGYYKVVEAKVRWETARRVCANHRGHLLILNSPEEAKAVVSSFPPKGWIWLGFDEYNNYNDFTTLWGTTLDEVGFNTWAPNQPKNSRNVSSCGAMTEKGELAVTRCNKSLGYICEMSESAAEYPPWVAYSPVDDHGYYRVHRERVRWETARRICEKEGAHLMVPNSEKEAVAVFKMAGGREKYYWLGFDNFDEHGGEYVNFDGERIGKSGVYSKWHAGEPLKQTPCGAGYKNTGELLRHHCEELYSFICELYKPGEKSRFIRKPTSHPPSGYTHIGYHFYRMYYCKKYWERARRACEKEGAHLLVLNSLSEQKALKNDGRIAGAIHFIGFDDYNGRYDNEWFDGNKEIDIDIINAGGCGCLHGSGSVSKCDCEHDLRFICEWEMPGTEEVYANSYRHVDGFGFYRFHRDRVAWETARRRCESEGAYLMVINSRAEAVAVLEKDKTITWRWVGFEDFDTEGTFRTVLGTTLEEAGYDQWDEPVPETKSCGAVSSETKGLGTFGCEDFKPYICELKDK